MPRLLLIDDDPDLIQAQATHALGPLDWRIDVARSGTDGLRRLAAEPPDVILLDSDVPKIDGAEVCRRIKTDATTQRIPVVMMTSSYIDIYDVGAEGGPEAFVVRPFAREVLANVVDRVLFRRPAARA